MKIFTEYLSLLAVLLGLSLTSCDIDPELTDSYPEDIAWSNDTNLRLTMNGLYSLLGGYYGSELSDDAYSDILKMNGTNDPQNLFVFGSAPITPQANPWNNWANRHAWQVTCCRFLRDLNKHRGNFSEENALEAEAEIRFFRAFVNFVLAKSLVGKFVV